MSRFYNEYEYDYDRIAQDTDELYDYDYNDDSDDDILEEDEREWENYYHNLADEIIED